MFVLLITVLGITLLGDGFVKFELFHVPMTYLMLGALFVSYIRYFIIHRGVFYLSKGEKSLMIFTLYGLLIVILSYFGVNQLFMGEGLHANTEYIPRHAFYLFVFPAIILFTDPFYTQKIDAFFKRFGEILFWGMYAFILISYQSMMVSAQMVMCWLSLFIGKKNKITFICRSAALLLAPLPIDGTSTVMIIRAVFLGVILFQLVLRGKNSRILIKALGCGVFVILIISFIMPFVVSSQDLSTDFNVYWRAEYWKDELTHAWNSYLLGVGYGISYASDEFAELSRKWSNGGGPFAGDEFYTPEEKVFVTGPHSSFIAVTFRLGLIGILTLLVFLYEMYKKLRVHASTITPAAYFGFFAAISLISFNVGLESPQYLISFIFAMGRCLQAIKQEEAENEEEEEETESYENTACCADCQ